jgi:hypothetical protein
MPQEAPCPHHPPPCCQRSHHRSGDMLSIELIQPDSMPAAVRVVWPSAPTITTPARYNEVASTAVRLLAEASTMLARIKASKRL